MLIILISPYRHTLFAVLKYFGISAMDFYGQADTTFFCSVLFMLIYKEWRVIAGQGHLEKEISFALAHRHFFSSARRLDVFALSNAFLEIDGFRFDPSDEFCKTFVSL